MPIPSAENVDIRRDRENSNTGTGKPIARDSRAQNALEVALIQGGQAVNSTPGNDQRTASALLAMMRPPPNGHGYGVVFPVIIATTLYIFLSHW
jgi:hypothetical protein